MRAQLSEAEAAAARSAQAERQLREQLAGAQAEAQRLGAEVQRLESAQAEQAAQHTRVSPVNLCCGAASKCMRAGIMGVSLMYLAKQSPCYLP